MGSLLSADKKRITETIGRLRRIEDRVSPVLGDIETLWDDIVALCDELRKTPLQVEGAKNLLVNLEDMNKCIRQCHNSLGDIDSSCSDSVLDLEEMEEKYGD